MHSTNLLTYLLIYLSQFNNILIFKSYAANYRNFPGESSQLNSRRFPVFPRVVDTLAEDVTDKNSFPSREDCHQSVVDTYILNTY